MEFYQEKPRQGVICNYGFTDHFKTGFMSVEFVLPLTNENATGMSLLAGVLSRGCKAYPQMDLISRYLARHYGASFSITASKVGEIELLNLSFTHLNNEFAIDGEDIRCAIVALFREMVFNPLVENSSFNAEYVEQEKINLSNKITGVFNDKRLYALEKCKALMCKNEAFGISEMGDQETLQKFNAASLYQFFLKVMNQAHVVITYVGKKQEHSLSALAKEFADRTTSMPQTVINNSVEKVREIVDPMELNQSKLTMGFRFGEMAARHGAACRLFNVLYGGSATSKLFMNVRERLSLCYYCSSTLDRLKNVMFVSSGIEADKYEEARREIEAQLKAVATGEFTDNELENARIYLIDSLQGSQDSQGILAGQLVFGTLRGKIQTLEEEIEEISKVTRADIIAVAREVALDTVYFLKGVHNRE